MDEIARLRQQIEIEQQLREAEKRREEAEQRLEHNTLFGLLKGCHKLSQAIQVETDATLTTQEDPAHAINRIYPKHIVHWDDFPDLQENVWDVFRGESTFASQNLFASDHQLELILEGITKIHSEWSLRFFEQDTVDRFTQAILNELIRYKPLRHHFRIKGDGVFEDHANIGTARSEPYRRNDQFCVHVVANEQRVPIFAVEYKAPYKVPLPILIAGLHEMDLDRDVLNADDDSPEYYTRHLVAALVTQIFSYMVDIGVQKGLICTGEADVYLYITEDPSVIKYFLCVPNKDVLGSNEFHLHRTAIAQRLAFTLNALQDDRPSPKWHDAAHILDTWKVEYIDVLRNLPESIRKEPPFSEYTPSPWKPFKRSPYKLRSGCRATQGTPRTGIDDDEGGDDDGLSPPATPSPIRGGALGRVPANSRAQCARVVSSRGNHQQQSDGIEMSYGRGAWRPYCTMACIQGLSQGGVLDPACPNARDHGFQRHQLHAQDFIRLLSAQLSKDREYGFGQLHIRGRTGFLLKATLSPYGYTIIIKATTSERVPGLKHEIEIYSRLRDLQGSHIPVCIGGFAPQVPYYYHGKVMAHMMILSWAGVRADKVIAKDKDKESCFLKQRQELLTQIKSYGVTHRDPEWRNVLWNDEIKGLLMIDFEDAPGQNLVNRSPNRKA